MICSTILRSVSNGVDFIKSNYLKIKRQKQVDSTQQSIKIYLLLELELRSIIRDNLFSVTSPDLLSPVVFIGLKLINICYLQGSSELNRKARVVSGFDIIRKCRYSRCVAPRPIRFLQVGIPQFECCLWSQIGYEVRSKTKLAFRVVESLFRFVLLCTEFVSSTSQIISSWFGPFVSSSTSSSRRLPRSSRRHQTCRHRVRLVYSWDRLITHHSSSTRQVQSSSRRTLGSTRRELIMIDRDWDRIVRSTWKVEELRGMLENATNKIEAISSTPTPNDNNNNSPRSTSSIPVISRAEAN